MAIRNSHSLTFRPTGVTDTLDATNAKSGSMRKLANLVPASSSKYLWEPRPARFWFVDFAFADPPFDTPTQVTGLLVIGNRAYGMVTTRRFPGFDEPFVCDMTTGEFTTLIGVTASNVPASPPASGEWEPPIIAKVGQRILVTHPGFSGFTDVFGIRKRQFGWFDISGYSQTFDATLSAGFEAITMASVFGLQSGFAVSGIGIPSGSVIVDIVQPDLTNVRGGFNSLGDATLFIYLDITGGKIPSGPLIGQTVTGPGVPIGTTVLGTTVAGTSSTLTIFAVTISLPSTASVAPIDGYSFSGIYAIVIDKLVTGGGASTLTITGGTAASPMWGSGDTSIQNLPSRPVGVSERNGRAWFACGSDGIPYTDSLLPCLRTNASQALIPGNGLPVTAIAALGQESATTGDIAQATIAFQGADACQIITGDQATFDLAIDALNPPTGTLAPLSIAPCTLGIAFVSPQGLRVIDFSTHVSAPIGADGEGVTAPFLNVSLPSRMCAAANSETIRIAMMDSRTPGEPIVEWWYNIPRKVWSGPHTLHTSLLQRWANPQFGTDSFIAAAADVAGKLYHSDSYVSGTSDFEEDGIPLRWLYQTSLLPDNRQQAMNAVVQALLSMALTGQQVLTIRVLDEYEVELDSIEVAANYKPPRWDAARYAASNWDSTNAVFRQFALFWQKPLVFKQAFLEVEGDSVWGFSIGDFFMRWQPLGYQGPTYPLDPMVAGPAPLYGLSQALIIGNGATRGTVIGPLVAKPNIVFTNEDPVGGRSVLGTGDEGIGDVSFSLTIKGRAALPSNREPLFEVKAFADSATGDTHGSKDITNLSKDIVGAGWAVGWAIEDDEGVIPDDTVIASIAADGLSLTLSDVASQTLAGVHLRVSGSNLVTAWTQTPIAGTYPGELVARAPGWLPTKVPFLLTIANGLFLLDDQGRIIVDADGLPLFTGDVVPPPPPPPPPVALTQRVTLFGLVKPTTQRVTITGTAPLPVTQSVTLTGTNPAKTQSVTLTGTNPALTQSVTLTGVAPTGGGVPLTRRITLVGFSTALTQRVALQGLTNARTQRVQLQGLTNARTQRVTLIGRPAPKTVSVTLVGVPSPPLTQRVSLQGLPPGVLGLTQRVILTGQQAAPSSLTQRVTLTGLGQTISSISPTSLDLATTGATAGTLLARIAVTMAPSSPAFNGTFSLSGADAASFFINNITGDLSVGPNDLSAMTYNFNVVAAETGATNTPATFPFQVRVTVATTGDVYSVIVTMDAGPVYTYSMLGGTNQAVLAQQQFVSDFANFTQARVRVSRSDTALAVIFCQDVAPIAGAHPQVILELSGLTLTAAANLGPFTLQIFKNGVAQPIPYPSISDQLATSTAPHVPSMGWASRWRWNPVPRPEVRTRASLLPSGLNLVPNYSLALAQQYAAPVIGASGNPLTVVNSYSSAWNVSGTQAGVTPPNDTNRAGFNSAAGTNPNTGGTGGRPELGFVTGWQAYYLLNGDSVSQKAMYALAEVGSGMPCRMVDSTTNYGPANFNDHPFYGWLNASFSGHLDAYTVFQSPAIIMPDGPANWVWDPSHIPGYAYIPYLLTGDPYYLEQMQDVATTLIANGTFYIDGGVPETLVDPLGSPATTFNGQRFNCQLGRQQSRAMAWGMTRLGQALMASPTTVPNWLLPKSYWQNALTANQQIIDEWSTNYATAHPGLKQYPEIQAMGSLARNNEREYALYMQYMGVAIGFLVNQCLQANWLPFYNYVSKLILAWTGGVSSTYDKRWPTTYGCFIVPLSTDYDGNPATFTSVGDCYTFMQNSALLANGAQTAVGWTIPTNATLAPVFAAWVPNTSYHCNSWMIEVRTGAPRPANAGDIISLTFTGSFSGSPVTISHTVTSGEATALVQQSRDVLAGNAPSSQVMTAIINAINANGSLSAAGIVASLNVANAGRGATGFGGSANVGLADTNRCYISFNSDGTSVTGGPVIGNITITGSFTTTSPGTLYIVPNGDGVINGRAGNNLYNRALSYQCGASGTSGSSGPGGQALQTLVTDGTCKWCFAPEFKSRPGIVPGPSLVAFPSYGYGDPYNDVDSTIGYLWWTMAGLASMQNAGIVGADTGRANIVAEVGTYQARFPGGQVGDWQFAIAPSGGIVITSP